LLKRHTQKGIEGSNPSLTGFILQRGRKYAGMADFQRLPTSLLARHDTSVPPASVYVRPLLAGCPVAVVLTLASPAERVTWVFTGSASPGPEWCRVATMIAAPESYQPKHAPVINVFLSLLFTRGRRIVITILIIRRSACSNRRITIQTAYKDSEGRNQEFPARNGFGHFLQQFSKLRFKTQCVRLFDPPRRRSARERHHPRRPGLCGHTQRTGTRPRQRRDGMEKKLTRAMDGRRFVFRYCSCRRSLAEGRRLGPTQGREFNGAGGARDSQVVTAFVAQVSRWTFIVP